MGVITVNTLIVSLMGIALVKPAFSTGYFDQQSNFWEENNSFGKRVKDLWGKLGVDPWRQTTRDPWTKSTMDPWTKSTLPKTTKDPWTKQTMDPWTRSTMDPWTRSTRDPWTRSTRDPWTRPTMDPWTKPQINPMSTKNPVDPWTRPAMSISTDSSTNTLPVGDPRSQTPTGQDNNNNNNNGVGTSSNGGGSTANCQNALRQCSLFGVDAASLDNVYQKAFATLLQKQRLSHQANLIDARDFFINVFNQFILNPDINMSSMTCAGANVPVVVQNDPAAVVPDPDSLPDVYVPPLAKCVVSEWSAWSLPLAFGIVERTRTIKQRGQCCPDDLVQRVNISSYLNQNNDAFENPNNVGENFHNQFMNGDPRDILLVIDTSSSIFREDFEYMKEGIKLMIDLFCGGFGEGKQNNRLAILQFSTIPVLKHSFNEPQTPEALKAKVDTMEDFGGRTCTGDALIDAYNNIFKVSEGVRPNVPNDTLVVTDGQANCGANLLKAAQILQQKSKAIYALGIGIADDPQARAQVTSLVTNEDPHHIFSLARYVDFKKMIEYIKKRQSGKKCTPIISQTVGGAVAGYGRK